MKTETGLKNAKNRGLRSFCGPVRSFDFWGKGRPVTVTVNALGHQKTGLDWTFKHYINLYGYYLDLGEILSDHSIWTNKS